MSVGRGSQTRTLELLGVLCLTVGVVCVCACVCQDYGIVRGFQIYLKPLADLFEPYLSDDQSQELRLLDSRTHEPRAAVPALG